MSRRKSTVAPSSESTPIGQARAALPADLSSLLERAEAGLPAHQAALLNLMRALDEAAGCAAELVAALDGYEPEDGDQGGFEEDAAGVRWTLDNLRSQVEQYERGDAGVIRMAEAGNSAFAEFLLRRKAGLPIPEALAAGVAREWRAAGAPAEKGKATA